jgi:hypothetical protein
MRNGRGEAFERSVEIMTPLPVPVRTGKKYKNNTMSGRTGTVPVPNAAPAPLSPALAGCTKWREAAATLQGALRPDRRPCMPEQQHSVGLLFPKHAHYQSAQQLGEPHGAVHEE